MKKLNKLWLSLALILGFSVQIAAQAPMPKISPDPVTGKDHWYYLKNHGTLTSGEPDANTGGPRAAKVLNKHAETNTYRGVEAWKNQSTWGKFKVLQGSSEDTYYIVTDDGKYLMRNITNANNVTNVFGEESNKSEWKFEENFDYRGFAAFRIISYDESDIPRRLHLKVHNANYAIRSDYDKNETNSLWNFIPVPEENVDPVELSTAANPKWYTIRSLDYANSNTTTTRDYSYIYVGTADKLYHSKTNPVAWRFEAASAGKYYIINEAGKYISSNPREEGGNTYYDQIKVKDAPGIDCEFELVPTLGIKSTQMDYIIAQNFNATGEFILHPESDSPYDFINKTTEDRASKWLIEANMTMADLTIASSATLEVASGKQLTITGTIVNEGEIIIESGATVIGDIAGDATVKQDIATKRTYYMSLPVNRLTEVTGIANIATFDVGTNQWTLVNSAAKTDYPATAGVGFLAQVPGSTTDPVIFKGTLNSGNINVTLAQSTHTHFNYLGNPYPSYLKSADIAGNANIDGTIWLRTKDAGSGEFIFVTYNKEGGSETLPVGYDASLIAPMQGFWVKANTAGVASNFFTDAMRSHNTVGDNALFKAPQQIVSQRFILNISNGTSSDDAMLRFNADAGTGIDNWDSRKMMNDIAALNVYTVDAGTNLAINSYPSITEDVEIPVGLNISAGTYTLSAKNFINFEEGTKVNLIDKETGIVTDLATGSYEFSLGEALNNSTRFALVFPRANVGTGIDTQLSNYVFAFARDGRVVVNTTDSGTIYVFNGIGQRVAAQAVTGTVTELQTALPAGVYVVKLNNLTTKVVVK